MKREITRYCTVILCLLLTSSLFAQNSTITGKVLDPDGQAVSFANVVLHTTTDSSMVKVEYTNDDGSFQMSSIPAGEYWINISFVGLNPHNSEIFQLSAGEKKQISEIQLTNASTDLDEVVVTAQRPLLELKPDKTVFNVEGSANATGSDALELLRKAPGVVVDNNDNITMLGRAGVQIYIDGKPSPLTGDDLAAFLKSLQSTEIDNIELITNPSAKYEAQGNAGIINIRLKKDKKLGANANLNLGTAVGRVTRYNGSVSGNYRDKKINVFGNYGLYDGENWNRFDLYREQPDVNNNNELTFYDQNSIQGGGYNSHNFKAGTDFFLNKKHTIGFIFNGSINDYSWNNDSRMPIGMVATGITDSVLVAKSNNDGERNNLNFNLNYQFDDNKGQTWNIDADYGRFRNNSTGFQPNFYYSADESTLLRENTFSTITPTDIDIYTFKIDHERPFLKGKLGAGIKISQVETFNVFDFYSRIDGEDVLDIGRSNKFDYTENVNAAYVSFNRQIKKFGINVGLRAEQTNSIGDLTSAFPSPEDYVERNYLDFFPSGGITYTPNQKHSFQLSYSRRINRPSYQDLNPFKSQLDELTFEQGNAFLQPEYANNIQLTHSFNYMLNTTLSFSHTTDLITRITDIDEDNSNASFITWLNLADQYNYSLSVSAPIPIKDWWSSYTSLTGYYTHNEADYGDGKIVDLDVYAFNVYSQQTFRLPKDLSLELSGWYSSPSIWGGTFEMQSQWSLDAGLQKKILAGRGNIKLSVSDIFRTTAWRGTSIFGNLYMQASGAWDSRRVRVNFSYLFGNTQVKGARKRRTGLEDESKRIKTGN